MPDVGLVSGRSARVSTTNVAASTHGLVSTDSIDSANVAMILLRQGSPSIVTSCSRKSVSRAYAQCAGGAPQSLSPEQFMTSGCTGHHRPLSYTQIGRRPILSLTPLPHDS